MQGHEDLNGKFEAVVRNTQTSEVLEKLEELEDQVLAVDYLKRLNDKTAELGKYLMNRDTSIDHGRWKVRCDELKDEVDQLISEIISQ